MISQAHPWHSILSSYWTDLLIQGQPFADGNGPVNLESLRQQVKTPLPHPAAIYFFPFRQPQCALQSHTIILDPLYMQLFVAAAPVINQHAAQTFVQAKLKDGPPRYPSYSGHDISIVVCDIPKGVTLEQPSYCLGMPSIGNDNLLKFGVNILGFPKNGSGQHHHAAGVDRVVMRRTMMSSNGNILSVIKGFQDEHGRVIEHDAATTNGDSGSPLFLAQQQLNVTDSCLLPFYSSMKHKRIIVGVHTGKAEGRTSNQAQSFGPTAVHFIKSCIGDIETLSLDGGFAPRYFRIILSYLLYH